MISQAGKTRRVGERLIAARSKLVSRAGGELWRRTYGVKVCASSIRKVCG